MLLKRLTLQNVRSYVDETIHFPSGSILMSGDIGSGKSSLLLAIEFALFGSSPSELPAESIMRKGAINSFVELAFDLQGKEIVIRRNLKKEKKGIKQTAGYVITNNFKKELTATELKAEIISLLGYPEDSVDKSKNYLFRYSVYTPQEEMKLILQESPEIRLDVLRKIFNLDKYKIIRDNLQMYLKTLRVRKSALEERILPLDKFMNQLAELASHKAKQMEELQIKEEELKQLKESTGLLKEELEKLEKNQKEILEYKQEQRTKKHLLEDRDKLRDKIESNLHRTDEELKALKIPEGADNLLLAEEIKIIESNINQLTFAKANLGEKINQAQINIKKLSEEISAIEKEARLLDEKNKIKKILNEELAELESLEKARLNLEESLAKINGLIISGQNQIKASQELKRKVSSIDFCPTCLQKVSLSHKEDIIKAEDEKISQADALLSELNPKKEQLMHQKKNHETKIRYLFDRKNLLARIETEVLQLEQKISSADEKNSQLKEMVRKNNQLVEQLKKTSENEEIRLLEAELSHKKLVKDMLTHKKYLEQNKALTLAEFERLKGEINLLISQITEIERTLTDKRDFSLQINEKKMALEQKNQQENLLSLNKGRMEAGISHLLKEEQALNEQIAILSAEKEKLLKCKDNYYWLEEHFLKLTYNIEKHLLFKLYSLFNQLFQEWFSILIDSEEISAKIDEDFTPVIEQNGYELGFTSLSGGEKTSAALAYRLALNKVINDIVPQINTKDLLILDEPTDGFSGEQLDKVRDILDRLSLQQIIIVSHESKIESFVQKVIRISKEGHISKIS